MTPTQRKDRLLKYTLYATILLLGVATGIAIRHYSHISLAESLNIIDVATLIVTIFLAVYIPGVFDRQMQVRQEKKELLEKRIEDFQQLFRKVNILVQAGDETPRERLTVDNTLDVALSRLDTLVTLLDYLQLGNAFDQEIGQMREVTRQYRNLLIDLPPDRAYDNELRNTEENLYNQIDQTTSLLIFKISDI